MTRMRGIGSLFLYFSLFPSHALTRARSFSVLNDKNSSFDTRTHTHAHSLAKECACVCVRVCGFERRDSVRVRACVCAVF